MSDVLKAINWFAHLIGPHETPKVPGVVVTPTVPVTTKVPAPVGHHRDYGDTKFPIEISAWKVNWIPGVVQGYNLWDPLPAALKKKITDAGAANEDLSISMNDLDAIDDATWVKIKASVNF